MTVCDACFLHFTALYRFTRLMTISAFLCRQRGRWLFEGPPICGDTTRVVLLYGAPVVHILLGSITNLLIYHAHGTSYHG